MAICDGRRVLYISYINIINGVTQNIKQIAIIFVYFQAPCSEMIFLSAKNMLGQIIRISWLNLTSSFFCQTEWCVCMANYRCFWLGFIKAVIYEVIWIL